MDAKVPQEMLTDQGILMPEYMTRPYSYAANGLPYENYDESIASKLLEKAERIIRWIGWKKIKK